MTQGTAINEKFSMNFTYESLNPVPVAKPGPHNARELRTHQGIPGIACIDSGRLFATWYPGGTTECRENYALLSVSDDDGQSWTEAVAVVDPSHPDVRAFDPTLWHAPNGKLYWFWAQGCAGDNGISGLVDEVFDGLVGVWYVILENPGDAPDQFRFNAPRRISNGIMLNKPCVLSDGTWALPCSLWSVKSKNRIRHESLRPVYGAMMVVSEDEGESFSLRGSIDVTGIPGGASFDEHHFLELRDGRIACYIRAKTGVARSFSRDSGLTWSEPVLTGLPGPDSRFFLKRLQSGRILLVANDSSAVREKLTAFLSEDEGQTWKGKLLLDGCNGVSYPDGIQSKEGNIYISYDYNRTKGGYLYLARFTEEDILNGKIGQGSFLRREIDHSRPVPAHSDNTPATCTPQWRTDHECAKQSWHLQAGQSSTGKG